MNSERRLVIKTSSLNLIDKARMRFHSVMQRADIDKGKKEWL